MPQAYLPILLFSAVVVGFVGIFLWLPTLLAPKQHTATQPMPADDDAKLPFESGFDGHNTLAETARHPMHVRFYLMAILFVIFDLEIAFLLPFVMVWDVLSWGAFAGVMFFLTILTVGFVYEWQKGALDWS